MPSSRRILRSLTFSVLLGLTASCSSDSGGPLGPSQPLEPIIKDAAVVVDSTVLTLLSDSLERSTGTYRFRVIGNPAPILEPGNVIVGAQGPGFLRRVTSVSTSGDEITLVTTQAALTDVVERGSFHTTVQMTAPTGGPGSLQDGSADVRYGPLQADFLANGVSFSAAGLSLSNTDLCKELLSGNCPDWLKLTIPSGSIGFEPGVDIDGSIDDGEIKTFHTIATGALSLDLSVRAEATKEFTTSGDKKLAEVSKRFVAWVGGVPIVGKVTMSYTVGYSANAKLKTTYETGAGVTTQVDAGAKYAAATGWEGVWETDVQTQQKSTEWTAQADGEVRIFIRPELKIIFYEVVGPFINVEPWLKGEAHVGTQQCELKMSAGIDSKIGIKVDILDGLIPDYAEDFPGTPLSIFDYPCPIGTLKVTTQTTGTNPDPDGYTVTLDGGDPKSISATGEVTYVFLPEGTFSVQLGGVANNCTVGGQNPRPATILAGDTTTANFNVECTTETGTLEVIVSTSGVNQDSDGYTVVIDGAQSQNVTANDTATFAGLTAGSHSVSLEGIAPNCSVGGLNPASINVALGSTAQASFDVNCTSTQQITVTTQTTGTQLDPDGYTVSLDGGAAKSIDVNGTWTFPDVAVGQHTLELGDLAENCTVQGDNPRTVDVSAGVDALTMFDVVCLSGSLTVQAPTSGPAADIDPDGYTVTVDGTHVQQLDVNGSVTFPDLTTGTHTVEITGVDAPCIVTSFNPQTVEVPGTVTFSVSCGGGGKLALGEGAWGASGPLRTMNPDGTDDTELYWRARWPSWSPDGQRIAFGGSGGSQGIWAINADGSNLVQLTLTATCTSLCETDFEPDYSPDGSQIAFTRATRDTTLGNESFREIFVVPAAGGAVTQLTTFADSLTFREPSWSPDGSQIVVRGDDSKSPTGTDLYVMSASGGDMTNMTNLTNNTPWVVRAGAPVWSPDGSRIAFIQTDGVTTFEHGPSEIRVIDPAGGSSTLILSIADGETISRKMTWSPDGTRIMFRAHINGQHGNYTIKTDGTDLNLVSGIWPPGDPDWSP